MRNKHKKASQRILSLILVMVMALGMLPTSVLGDASGGAGGSVVPINPADGLTYNTSSSFGSFTRFTIVEIAAPDDSTTTRGPHTPDSG